MAVDKNNPFAELGSLLDMFSGKTTVVTDTPTTTTSSTKSNLSQDQINSLISEAMLPVQGASKAAGLYGDSTMQLARVQAATDVAAKYAGNTTTQTTSGGTRTSTTQGALQGDNGINALKLLGVAQVGAPILSKGKKFLDTLDLGDIGSSISDFASSLTGSGASAGFVSPGASADVVASTAGDFATNAANMVADAGGSQLLSGATDAVASAGDWLKDLFNFAEGGYVDRHTAISNLSNAAGAGDSVVNASGESAPARVTAPMDFTAFDAAMKGSGSSGTKVTPGTGNFDSPEDRDKNLASIAVTLAKLGNPLLGRLIENATGVESIQTRMRKQVTDMLGLTSFGYEEAASKTAQGNPETPSPDEEVVIQAMQKDPDQEDFAGLPGTIGGGGVAGDGEEESSSSGSSSSSSSGSWNPAGDQGNGVTTSPVTGGDSITTTNLGSAGGGDAAGGHITGPGTGTSDSIPTNLSNGEYVIDAKTVEALGPAFFQSIQAMFNPSVIPKQIAKGRI